MGQEDSKAQREAKRHAISDDERRALAVARRKGPRTAPPHPDAPRLIAPPISPNDLQSSGLDKAPRSSDRPLSGSLAGRFGERIRAPEIMLQRELDEIDLDTAKRVRAWRLPLLIGQIIVAPSIDDMPRAIGALLSERLGDLPFLIDDDHYGGPGKYFHMHTSVIAPPDGDEPMAIELYGKIVAFGDADIDSLAGGRVILAQHERRDALIQARSSQGRAPGVDAERFVRGSDLPTPLYILVQHAIYSNVLFCGVDVPFYM